MRQTNDYTARRGMNSTVGRATCREIDDDHLCQQIKSADTGFSRTHTDFEMWHPLGVTSVPQKQKDDQQQQQGQQGQGAGGQGGQQGGQGSDQDFNKNQPKGDAAEAMILYVNGHAEHPVGFINDRRVRPYQMKEGEGGLYAPHEKACVQIVYHRVRGDKNDGLYAVTADDQQQSGGGGSGAQALDTGSSSSGQQQQKRFISVSHVEKKPQTRKKQQQAGQSGGGGAGGLGGAGGAGGSQSSMSQPMGGEQYLHEGDSVNTEVRLTKQQIQFYKKSPQQSGSGGAATLTDTSGGGSSTSSGGGKQRQDGELRGYWDNDTTSWWWKADKQITHDADQQINLKAPKIKSDTQKKIFTGDVHILGNLYVGKEGYKPSDDVWLTGQPDPSADDVAIPTADPPDLAQQLEARARRRRVLEAITVDDDGNVNVKGNLHIDGNLTVGGVITARDFVRRDG